MAKINEDVSDAQGETNLSPAPTFEDTEGKSISKRKNPYYQALVILERRDHSEWEVRTKLARKGFSAVEIDSTIEKLIKVNFIDDERFARLYVENTLRFRCVGPRWLIYKLQQKHVASAAIEPAVYDAINDERELSLAREAAKQWRSRKAKRDSDADRTRQRLMRFLISRGFSFEAVQEVLG